MQHLVVISDLHLWQATDTDELWMRYRHRRFLPDAQLTELVELLCKTIPDGQLELVLNGDIFDFDIPPVYKGHPVATASPRREPAAVARLVQILDDHQLFIAALARLMMRGHRVVFIAGNHDLQLNFKGVQALLRERITQAARRLFVTDSATAIADRSAQQIAFHPWFYRTRSGVHIEHGNQYDPYCSVSDPEWPFHVDGALQTNVGALALEHLVGKLGYFNPNVESSFLLTTREYIEHWRRYYLRTPRSLIGTFVVGALRVIWKLWQAQGLFGPQPRCASLQTDEEAAHTSLFARADLRAAMRLFGVDRLLVAAAVLLGFLLGAIYLPLGIGAFLAGLMMYRACKPRGATDLRAVASQVDRTASRIARIYGASGVIFGHTHQPEGRWDSGVFYGNSGTWVPMYRDVACSIPIEESRPLIWLRDEAGVLKGGLFRFHEGKLHPTSPPRPDDAAPQSALQTREKTAHPPQLPRRGDELRSAADCWD